MDNGPLEPGYEHPRDLTLHGDLTIVEVVSSFLPNLWHYSVYPFIKTITKVKEVNEKSVHCSIKNINIMFISLWKLILSWQAYFNTTMTSLQLFFPVKKKGKKKRQFQHLKLYVYAKE